MAAMTVSDFAGTYLMNLLQGILGTLSGGGILLTFPTRYLVKYQILGWEFNALKWEVASLLCWE